MIFLAMIIALTLLQLGAVKHTVAHDGWFRSLQSSVRSLGLSPAVVFWLCIAIPALLANLLLAALEPLLFGLFWIAGAVIVLLYSFGRVDFESCVDRYDSYCRSGDFEGAYLYAQGQWGIEMMGEQLTTPQAVHSAIVRELLYTGYQRWFAVLFYFLLLGPVGALAYRLFQLSGEPDQGRLLYFLDWAPARLLAAGFALTGDFLGSRDALLSSLSDTDSSAGKVLLVVGRAAIGGRTSAEQQDDHAFSVMAAEEVSDLRALSSRSAGAWLIVVSLVVLLL